MALQSCTSNLKLDTGPAASQPQASKKPLRSLVGKEQHQEDKLISISAPTEKAPAVPAAQVAPAAPLFTDLSPSSSLHHTIAPPSLTTVLHNPRLSQGTPITQLPKDRPKAQAMRSAQPTQRPSAPLAKAEAAGAAPVQHLTASGGKEVALYQREGQWQAQVTERIGPAQRQVVLPIVCAPDCEVTALLGYEAGRVAQLLHVAKQGLAEFVYVGRQGLQGGMYREDEGAREHKQSDSSQPPAVSALARQGSTALEQAQSNIASLKEAIEEGYGLLLSLGTADSQVIAQLFSDLAQWLQEERLCRPAVGEEGAKEYITRLREDSRLSWGDHRAKLSALLTRAYEQPLQQLVGADLIAALPYSEPSQPLAVSALARQGSTALEQAQNNIASLKEAIEEGYGLLLSLGTADSQVIEKLFSDLEQWLQEEQLCRPAADDEDAKEYITRLREDSRLSWGDHRAKLSALLTQAYGQALQQVVAADLIHSLPDRVAQLSAALVGRQGLLGGMMPGVEEYKEVFPQKQSAPRGSLLKLGPSEHQGPTEFERAQEEATALKGAIEEQYGLLLSQDSKLADSQLVGGLLADLEQLLGLEALWTLEESEDSAQEYLVRLRNDDGLLLYGADVRERLMVLLERAYAQALKRAVSTTLLKGLSNLSHEEQERLAVALGQLAAFHQEQGRQTGDLSLYTDAAILYQHMLQVCEGEAEKAYRGLAEIKGAMIARCKQGKATLSSRVSSDELQDEIARDKQILQKLRIIAKRRVAELEGAEMSDEALYIEKSKALFAEIAQRVGAFLATLYQETEQVLGPAPCKYTVMGLGSMALQQMTPYSDLEFAILMEENESQEVLEEHRAYFRELSHLVHLRVINVGETVVPWSKYKVSLDYLGKRGINFDLGGKTPLGRKDKPYLKNPYELIQPVAGMMRYLKNEGDKSTHMDKLLPFILERTCHIHGDRKLHEAYVEEKREFFKNSQTEQGIPVYQARALEKLLEGVVELDYSHPGPGVAKPGQQGDLADFAPKVGYEDIGRLYDVKQEIYRLPDRLLYRLAMYYGLLPESGWDAVAQLSSRGIITREAAQHLGYAVSFATMLRLKTYLHQGQQGESMTVLGGMSQEAAQQFFVLSKEALQEGGSLFQYYYTALPLHEKMEAFFKGREGDLSPVQEENFFQEESFYNDSYRVRGHIHQRVMQHAAAKRCYKKALEIRQALYPGNHPDVAMSLNNVGNTYNTLGEASKGLEHFQQALEMCRALYPGNHFDVAGSLNNVGGAYQRLGEASKGLGYLEQALEMYRALYPGNHPEVAASLNNVGIAYEKLGESSKGLGYLEQALEMMRAVYPGNHSFVATFLNNVGSAYEKLGEVSKGLGYFQQALQMDRALYPGNHPSVAMSLNNVGSAYEKLGESSKGLGYLEQALEMYRALYPANHPDVAMSLNNVGGAYHTLGEASKGLGYFQQALQMRQALYPGNHPDVAASLNNVGGAYHTLGEAKEGLGYYEQALAMRQALYPANHPSVAMSLNNLGGAYNTLGEASKGLGYSEQVLKMKRVLYPGNHPSVAGSLNNVGIAYEMLGEAKKGLGYYEQALAMNKTLYGDKAHPDVAISLNKVGLAYYKLGDARKGLVYFEQAFAMNKTLYGDKAHRDLAESLNSLGIAHAKIGDAKQALVYHKRSLEMRQGLYGDKAHPDLASSLNNVGATYQALGETQKVLLYCEQALKMRQVLYPGNHPDVAMSLHNVGITHTTLGEANKGLEYSEQALEMERVLYPGNHPDVADSLNNVGIAYQTLGDGKQALAYFGQALLQMRQVLYKDKIHPALVNSLMNVGESYERLGEYEKAKQHYEEGLMISNKLPGEAHPYIQIFTQKLDGLVSRCYVEAANKAYVQHDVQEVIRNYEELLRMLPATSGDTKTIICQNLGCMYHVAALSATEAAVRQTSLNKATAAFEQALAWSDGAKAGLCTEYGNFLLATGQLAPAHDYLIQAIDSGDTQSGLGYGLMEKARVSPLLQARIDQDKQVEVRGIDYAYYLLIFHYKEFAQTGISLGQPRATYLTAYEQRIRASAGQPGKEKQDALAHFLFNSLQQALREE